MDGSGSPRSVSSSFSDLSDTLQLNSDTLALLDDFFATKAANQERFENIAAAVSAAHVAGVDAENDGDQCHQTAQPMISVPDFSIAFGEDWQLSQFWYTEAFATKLAQHLYKLCNPSTRIAFICCPTAFVAFQHTNPLPGARLLEVDQRFSVLAPSQYIVYDLHHPERVPEQLISSFDIIVVDPPFLNLDTNEKLAKTVNKLIKPDGKFVILTSPSVEDVLEKVYAVPPVGPLKRTPLVVQHGKLANAFACWGSWDGAEKFSSE